MSRLAFAVGIAVAITLLGCGADLERMTDQSNYRPFEAAPWFADGRAMRPPPSNTVPRSRVVGRPELTEGMRDGRDAVEIPLPVDRRLLELGRSRFNVFCAACHGLGGDGDSEVARNMELRKPPSLIKESIRAFPAGRIFRVATLGYGLMPAYAGDLTVEERWAVVAYLRALQLSQSVPLDRLPPAEREAATRVLP